ncbi:hypothetical protein [Paenibacillus sp. SI8]|uniref:hypothetical protein n=1 Tax=unclassified Paenibacillus TaxID=185978 RepID=UPI003467CDF6
MINLNIKHGLLLDSLADDGESIVQIEHYFITENEIITLDELKQLIIELVTLKYMFIAYPEEATMDDLVASYDDNFDGFWFEQTKEGRAYWQKIVL